MEYGKFLDTRTKSVSADLTLFKSWETGEITLDECFDQWWANNKPKLNRAEFKKFLNGMGYIGGKD